MANSQKDKKSDSNMELEKRVEALLGPPPQADKVNTSPEKSKPAPKAPPAPIPTEPKAEDEEPKERLLVIPPSDKIQPENKKTDAPATAESKKPALSELNQGGPSAALADATAKNQPAPHKSHLRRFFRKIWRNPITRKLLIFSFIAILVGVVATPTSRYFILNNVGVRSSVSLTVLDDSTQLPLKNVDVSIGDQSVKTDQNGYAKLFHIKLGSNQLTIQKRAFAAINKTVVIGWGSNPLGNYNVEPTGSQYAIFVKDWLTGKIITNASASGGGADAIADQKGKVLLTIDTTLAQLNSLPVTVKADGYRDETFSLDLGSKGSHTVRMVTDRKDVYISNQSGKYDVYSSDVDGKNAKLVLAGTGLERDDIVLVQHPTDDVAALVSTRVNARNTDGYLLSTLTLINLKDNTTLAVDQSEQVQVIGWIGSRLIYVKIAAGASASNPDRFRLLSFDYKSANKKQLDSANLFNDVMLDGNFVYYAPSAAYQKDPNTGLIQSSADGSSKKTILKNEVWNIFHVSYDTLNLATATDWYEYKIGSPATPIKLQDAPANPKNRLYITSQDGKNSLWVDQRDGKGLLIDYDTSKQTDTTLVTAAGLVYPVKWLTNSVLVYRIHNDQETADYVLDITGGKSHKITDVFNAAGINKWYFY